MSARLVLVLISGIGLVYRLVLMHLSNVQRTRPLPPEVSDVYDPDRYQKYLGYVADNKKCGLAFGLAELAVTMLLLFSGVFAALERAASGNVYRIYLYTMLLFLAAQSLTGIPARWVDRFVIEEKYGMNRQDRRGFIKDTLLSIVQETVLTGALGLALVFIGEHLPRWTRGFTLLPWQVLALVLALSLGLGLLVLLASLFSLWILKKQYTFTPMPEGPLKEKIMRLQEGSKRRVSRIYVYDESRKSTSKNAFLLKLLWHREFGIADNFLRENAEDELLGVLSHEIGHLRHRRNLLNYLSLAQIPAVLLAMGALLLNPAPVQALTGWVRASFGLSVNNYYLLMETAASLLSPLLYVRGVFENYRSRQEEYEADREAVKNGYGPALITAFKQLSRDELVNVNPHPAIEFLEYNHPGMASRIRAMEKEGGRA